MVETITEYLEKRHKEALEGYVEYAKSKGLTPETPIIASDATIKRDEKDMMYDQSEVNYTTLSQVKGKACANCRWLQYSSYCRIVESSPLNILPTGYCDEWTELPAPENPQEELIEVLEAIESGVMNVSSSIGYMEKKPSTKSLKERLLAIIGYKEQPKARDEPFIGFKDIGDNRWLACWGNNFKDREGEIFAEKATDAYIARVDNGTVPYPDLHYWHIPRPIGKADYVARIDHMNVASGVYFDDPLSQAMKKSLKEEGVLPVSHGYYYPTVALQDGVYHYYDTFEISPLPKNKEANSFTSFKDEKGMNDEKRRDLVARLGKEFAEKYITEVENFSKEIEKTGQDYKELTVSDPTARKEINDLTALVGTLATSVKELVDSQKAAKKPADDEEDKDGKMDKLFGGKKKEFDDAIAAAKAATAALEAKQKEFNELTPRQASKDKSTEIDATDPRIAEQVLANQAQTEAKKEFNQIFGSVFPSVNGAS